MRKEIYILLYLFLVFCTPGVCQDTAREREMKERKRMYEEFHKEYEAEMERVKKDAFKMDGVLLDFSDESMCKGDPAGSGIFIFNVRGSEKKELIGKKVFIQIQCGNHKKGEFVKNQTYELFVTPDKSNYDSEFMDGRFEGLHYSQYYCITIDPDGSDKK